MRASLLLIMVLMCLQASAQTLKKQRLVRVTRQYYNSPFTDTVHYGYSEDRGIIEFRPYDFHHGDRMFGFQVTVGEWMFYDSPSEHMPDPVFDVYDNTYFPDFAIYVYGKNRFRDTSSYTYEGRNVTSRKQRNNYIETKFNNANRPLTSNYWWLDINNQAIVGKRVIKYDDYQRVIADTSFGHPSTGHAPCRMNKYTYNINGNVSKIIHHEGEDITRLTETRFTEYTYNTAGQILDIRYKTDSNWIESSYREVYTYDGQNRLTGFYSQEQGYLSPFYQLAYSNNSKLPDTLIDHRTVERGTVCYKTRFYYNSFGYPDSAITQAFSFCTTPTPVITKTYYKYETYGVEDTTTDNGRFVLYPNPADKQITIRWSWKQPKEPVYIQVYNAIGREVLKTYVPKANKTETLNVSSLLPGVYILRIRTDLGKKVHTEKFTVY